MIYITLFFTLTLASLSLSMMSPILVLKKESMFVDAISHSVLPGIVLAYLIVGSLDSILFDLLAVLFCFLSALFLKYIFNLFKISKESIIGTFYTVLFSLGVLGVVFFANDVHLDADAVLFGQLEYTIFEPSFFTFIPFLSFTHVKLLFLLGLVFLWRKYFAYQLFCESFDHVFSRFNLSNLNIQNNLFYLILSILLILSFKILGVVLVLSVAVAPALISKLFAKNYEQIFSYSMLYAIVSSFVSVLIAIYLNISIAGAVAFFNMLALIFFNYLKTNFVHKN